MEFLSSKSKPQDDRKPTTKKVGDAAETAALEYLLDHGLRLVARNYRTPGRGGGEIDLIMREPDGTLVFHRGSQASIRLAMAALLLVLVLPSKDALSLRPASI